MRAALFRGQKVVIGFTTGFAAALAFARILASRFASTGRLVAVVADRLVRIPPLSFFRRFVHVGILTLAGCGGLVAEKPVATAIAVQKPIEVAVLVKCMTAADIPALPTTVFNKNEQDPEKLALAAKIDLAEARLYIVAADAQMRRCAGQPEPKK